jgi:dienelactone hydrolase
LLAGAPVRAESAIVHFGANMADGSKVELVARLVTPSGNAPFAAVVLLHGCDGTDLHSDWVERSFAGWPYAFLDVDSLGPRGVAQACEGYGKVSPTMRARDAHAAREWLAAQPFIDGHRIAVMGWSMGAETALQAISNPYINEPDRAVPFAAAIAFYPSCPLKLRHPDAPLLVLIGAADDWTPPGSCRSMERIADSLPPFELVEYANATHAFDWAEAPARYFGHQLRYDAAATEDAYARARTFLAKYLN